MELQLAQIKNHEKVLHIGCGSIPYTSILISKETNANIIGIDKNPRVAQFATNFIKRYNFSEKIKIKIGDGKTYDISDFDVVIISTGVDNQDMILKNVFNSIKNNAKIILRRYKLMKNDYIDSTIKKYITCSIQPLIIHESILINKRV